MSNSYHRVKYAIIRHTKYAVGYVVTCYIDDNEDYVFGLIKDIVLTATKECVFILTPFLSTYNYHFHSYEVFPVLDKIFIYHQRDFLDHHPLTISKNFNTNSPSFVCLKYHLF